MGANVSAPRCQSFFQGSLAYCWGTEPFEIWAAATDAQDHLNHSLPILIHGLMPPMESSRQALEEAGDHGPDKLAVRSTPMSAHVPVRP